MANDGILTGTEVRQKLLAGAVKLTDAVSCTLGPRGQNVILYQKGAAPVITKDGVTVARVVELEDDFEQAGVEVLRQAALQTNTVAGDGTTTSTVLAKAILEEANRQITAGAIPIEVKRGMDKAVEKIIESHELQKLVEVSPQLQEFLQENFDKITSVPEVRNAINLSNAVSNAFNFPKLTLEELEEGKSYTLKDGITPSIYDMVCRQELVKRELLESKQNFDTIWANNDSIQKLAGLVFGSDEEVVGALSEALQDIPYLALASKKSLFSTFSNCLTHADGIGVSDKDIQGFASRIFEYKKDVKESFIHNIHEKYGVNIQNLQSPASFKSLANTQVIIFEALSRLSPKGSVLKEVLSEMAQSLKSKSGVECIDVNDYLLEMFVTVGYDQLLQEDASDTLSKVDFKRVTKDVTDIQDLVRTLQEKVVKDEERPSDENLDNKALANQEDAEGAPEAPPEEEESPAEEDIPADEEAPSMEAPDVPPAKSEDEAIGGLADIENMVADIVAELGEDDDTEDEEEAK